jgi:hypothetical protein
MPDGIVRLTRFTRALRRRTADVVENDGIAHPRTTSYALILRVNRKIQRAMKRIRSRMDSST